MSNTHTYSLLFCTVLLTACSTAPKHNCIERAQGASSQAPCWLVNKPEQGLVLKGDRTSWGADSWFKTQQKLFNQAIATFAQQRAGNEVSTSAVVQSNTAVTLANGKEQVNSRVEVQETTEISQSDNAITVHATLKDYYYYPPTESVYIWAVETR